ncbi:MAG: hypothetical protein SFU98_16615 [Leptospiraceae bacterium]|nr:hypothetical protein [Leptospiraceae bacterium]
MESKNKFKQKNSKKNTGNFFPKPYLMYVNTSSSRPVLSNKTLEDYFKKEKNANLVKSDLFKIYRASINSHSFQDIKAERNLIGLAVLSSIYQLQILVNDEAIFQFGIELVKLESLKSYWEEYKKSKNILFTDYSEIHLVKTVKVKETNFFVYVISGKKNKTELMVFFLVPELARPEDYKNSELFQFINYYYLYFPNEKEKKVILEFTNFKDKFRNAILSMTYEKELFGVVAHFYVEDLNVYFEHMGEQFTVNLITEIAKTIRKYLKNTDLLYTINKRSYIVYLPECDIQTVSDRFKEVYFKIDQLIIKYKLDFYEIKNENIGDDDFLDKLISNELRIKEK